MCTASFSHGSTPMRGHPLNKFPPAPEPEPDRTVLSCDWLFTTSRVPPPESFSWVVLELVVRSTCTTFSLEDFKTTITSTFPTPSTDFRIFLIRFSICAS